jgi:hypothetical protein
VILSNGCYCLIREKGLGPDGLLRIVAESWDSEADHLASPDAPHHAEDHLFGPYKQPAFHQDGSPVLNDAAHQIALPVPTAAHHDVHGRILDVLNRHHVPGSRRHAVSALVGDHDRWGFLDHPHVKALEVVPR